MGKVTFELNDPEAFALTTKQLQTMYLVIEENGPALDYNVVEADNPDRPHVKFWVHWPDALKLNPSRYWIDADGTIGMVEEVTWDWKGE